MLPEQFFAFAMANGARQFVQDLRRLTAILFQVQNDIGNITVQKLLIRLCQIAVIKIGNQQLMKRQFTGIIASTRQLLRARAK